MADILQQYITLVQILTVQVVWCVLCCLMVRDRPRSASLAVRPQAEAARVVTNTLRAFCRKQHTQAVHQAGRSIMGVVERLKRPLVQCNGTHSHTMGVCRVIIKRGHST
jgi:hypothetical protein